MGRGLARFPVCAALAPANSNCVPCHAGLPAHVVRYGPALSVSSNALCVTLIRYASSRGRGVSRAQRWPVDIFHRRYSAPPGPGGAVLATRSFRPDHMLVYDPAKCETTIR